MFTILLIFFASCLVSFIGSLQLGPVNLFVINAALYNSRRAAFWVAVGGSVPEFIYCALAVFASGFLQQSDLFQLVFKILFILILIIIGFVFLLKKKSPLKPDNPNLSPQANAMKNTFKGFSLAALNPQLLPFWILVQVYFNTIAVLQIETTWHKIAFIAGAGCGAFALLTLLLVLFSRYKEKMLKYFNTTWYFKALAFFFFAMAAHQLYVIFNKK